jgi:lipoate-protein ligase A
MVLTLLPFLEGNAGLQMAVDEMLFNTWRRNGSAAAMRFYRIDPPAVTIGYHQKESSLSCFISGDSIEIVRRPTGGRAVLHSGDLTYSVVGELGESVFGTKTLEIYQAISRGVKRGIERLGVDLDLVEAGKGGSSPLCFQASSKNELSHGGHKVCGGALMRRDGRFLFQGSILAEPPSHPFCGFVGGGASLAEIAGRRLEVSEVVDEIEEGFREEFEARICRQKWPMDLLDKKASLW